MKPSLKRSGCTKSALQFRRPRSRACALAIGCDAVQEDRQSSSRRAESRSPFSMAPTASSSPIQRAANCKRSSIPIRRSSRSARRTGPTTKRRPFSRRPATARGLMLLPDQRQPPANRRTARHPQQVPRSRRLGKTHPRDGSSRGADRLHVLARRAKAERNLQTGALFERGANTPAMLRRTWPCVGTPKDNACSSSREDAPLTHAVWVYDMEREDKRRLFPPGGQTTGHVVFDLLRDGQHIVCVAAGADMGSSLSVAAEPNRGKRRSAPSTGSRPSSGVSGIWLGSVEGTNWWHVPESQQPEQDNVPGGLSTLIAHRPVCSKDSRQLAFVGDQKRDKDSLVASLFRADVKDKKVERVFTTAGEIHDLRWSPDGSRLGFVLVEPKTSSFHVVDAHGHVLKPLGDRFVREFAGWNATGDKLAVVSQKVPADIFATRFDLLVPNPLAYDAVLIADEKGVERTLLSGLQFTFPQWSPKRDQLSMWGTYQPSHLTMTSEMGGGLGLGIGLRRGDPAAILDVSTGSVRWLAINGDEIAQVGHYYLSKHDPAQAREWYRKADKQLAKLQPLHPDDLIHGLSGSAARRRTFEFFYYLCLSQLNESQEAAQRLALFDGAHRIDWRAAPQSTVPTPAAEMAAARYESAGRSRSILARRIAPRGGKARGHRQSTFDRPNLSEYRPTRRGAGLVFATTRHGRR